MLVISNVSHGYGKDVPTKAWVKRLPIWLQEKLPVVLKGQRYTQILNNINTKINTGEIVALVGPSGCGKSTLLRAIIGTHQPTVGEVLIDGEKITSPTRKIGIVYQQQRVYDFLTAEKNVAEGLKLDQTTFPIRIFKPRYWRKLRRKHLHKTRQLLIKMGLGHALKLYPRELSGGMVQRVAIAQALIMEPKVILLDEPFSALDEQTLADLHQIILNLKNSPEHPTIIMVTHELEDAFHLADRVIGLSRNYEQGEILGSKVVYDEEAPEYNPDDPEALKEYGRKLKKLREAIFAQ
jgi:NitT/TauT family transport system ATP-binding protein